MVTRAFMWLVGNQDNKVFVTCHLYISNFYLILFVLLKLVELYVVKRSKDLLEFWSFWSVFASDVDFPSCFPSVGVLRRKDVPNSQCDK